MKKTALTILTILILALTACGGASDSKQADSNQLSDSYENALPISTQLLIGTFELEGTDLAVTSEQASNLIPLWQVLKTLSSSDSAAEEESDALVDQIQETMTPEQIQAIKEMNLTPQDMFAILQQQGIAGQGAPVIIQGDGPGSFGEGSAFPVPPPDGGGDNVFIGPGGGGGPGSSPGGGFGGGQGQGLSPEQIATAQARRTEDGAGGFRFNGTPVPLIEALIGFLQKKAGA